MASESTATIDPFRAIAISCWCMILPCIFYLGGKFFLMLFHQGANASRTKFNLLIFGFWLSLVGIAVFSIVGGSTGYLGTSDFVETAWSACGTATELIYVLYIYFRSYALMQAINRGRITFWLARICSIGLVLQLGFGIAAAGSIAYDMIALLNVIVLLVFDVYCILGFGKYIKQNRQVIEMDTSDELTIIAVWGRRAAVFTLTVVGFYLIHVVILQVADVSQGVWFLFASLTWCLILVATSGVLFCMIAMKQELLGRKQAPHDATVPSFVDVTKTSDGNSKGISRLTDASSEASRNVLTTESKSNEIGIQ